MVFCRFSRDIKQSYGWLKFLISNQYRLVHIISKNRDRVEEAIKQFQFSI